MLNLEPTAALSHTCLHRTRLQQAVAAGGPPAVLDAFKLCDESAVEDWLAEVSHWLTALLLCSPSVLSLSVCRMALSQCALSVFPHYAPRVLLLSVLAQGAVVLAQVSRQKPEVLPCELSQPWGPWGGVALPPVGAHPWLCPSPPGDISIVCQSVSLFATLIHATD